MSSTIRVRNLDGGADSPGTGTDEPLALQSGN